MRATRRQRQSRSRRLVGAMTAFQIDVRESLSPSPVVALSSRASMPLPPTGAVFINPQRQGCPILAVLGRIRHALIDIHCDLHLILILQVPPISISEPHARTPANKGCRLLGLIQNMSASFSPSVVLTRAFFPPPVFVWGNVLPGPLTLRMMLRVVSSINSTRTCVTPPREPVAFVLVESHEGSG